MKTQSRALDLFSQAHELEEESRDAFLDEACGDDAELRLEVQQLLVKAKKVDSFFAGDEDRTVVGKEPVPGRIEGEGEQVGPYILRQEIGEGGFGIVWMAEQTEPISRMVALKVVKAGMDTRQVLARFEAERQALAMMEHPNIAKVLDAGATASGRPYFAMELVKGVPITDFCNDQNYGPRQRLELFKDVCAAVNHAHQKGIIHRDLKPSNVLITLIADKPVVEVIDFGIAKATPTKLTEKTLFTRFEQFLGTPVYMSPEQAAMSGLDVDTRSDIYSLGVLLYELLAGAPPFDQKTLLSGGYDEMRRIIREEDPLKPSALLTRTEQTADSKQRSHVSSVSLKGDLDWIVMKAIDKDRTRRYETANSFAADIDRYLADEPVRAAAPSAIYLVKKFARRHKAAFGVAAAMVALLLAGIAATGWQAYRATLEKDRAVEAESLAQQLLGESEAARRESEAVSDFLSDILKSPRPESDSGGRDVRVADLLDEATRRLDSAQNISPDRIASLRRDLAVTYSGLGLNENALTLREKVANHFLETQGPESREAIGARMDVSISLFEAGRFGEALTLRRELLETSDHVFGSGDLLTIQLMGNVANSLEQADQLDEALELREQAFQLCHEFVDEDHEERFHTAVNLARSYAGTDRKDEARRLREEAVELSQRVFPDDDPLRLSAMQVLALSYDEAGRAEDALALRKEILKRLREIRGPNHPGTPFASRMVADSYDSVERHDEPPEPAAAGAVKLPHVLADFDQSEGGDIWLAVNDNVMGGRSTGGPSIQDGTLLFSGETVTDRGGFSSTRIRAWQEPLDLSSADAVQLRVKGDGRTYLFEMRTTARVTPMNTVPYRAEFATRAGEWIEVTIPLDQLEPTVDGFFVMGTAPPLDTKNIRTFGLMIYDKKEGKFELEVDWIKAVSAN